jgi:hypothetical protein
MTQEKSMSGESPRTDQHMDELMGLLLRCGVILAACIVLVGGTIYLARYPRPSDYPFSGAKRRICARFRGFLAKQLLFTDVD